MHVNKGLPELLSVERLARRVDVPRVTLLRLLDAHQIQADFRSGRSLLFQAAKIDVVRAKLHTAGPQFIH